MGAVDRHPQPCIDHFVDMLHGFISAERFMLSAIYRSRCQKEMVFIEIQNQTFSCCPFIKLLHSLALGLLLVNLVQHSNPRTVTPLD